MDALNYFFNVSRFDWIIIPIILCSFLLASGVIIFASLTLKYMFSSSPLIPRPYYATAFKVTFIAFFLFAISKSFVIKEDDVITSTYYQDFSSAQRDEISKAASESSPFLNSGEMRLIDLLTIIY
jgi:hypothetical protein